MMLGILAVFGMTYILTTKDGPFGILYKLRLKLAPLRCFDCTSVYVGAFAGAITTSNISEFVIHSLAYTGGAILINIIVERCYS